MDTEAATQPDLPTYVRLRERLRQDIVSGHWPLGQHVTLSDLAAHYRVSGNPIREALLHLEGDGVVHMRMHRGAVIPTVDRRFVENVYDINIALGVMLIRDVVRRIRAPDLTAIEHQAHAFEAAATADDTVAMVACNRAFHRTINAIADNPPGAEMLRGRLTLIDALRVGVGYRTGRLDEIVAQHREIVDALQNRKAAAAVGAVTRHVESAKQDLLARMDDRDAAAKYPATEHRGTIALKITGIDTFAVQVGPPQGAGGKTEGAAGTMATATGLPFGTTRHWLFIELHTDAGLVGVGEGSGWPLVVERAIQDIAPVIVGEDPAHIERLWLKMRAAMGNHGMTGTVGGGVLSAIEMALWDIKGKALDTPVWNLLGGKVRDRVRVYAHASTPGHARDCVALGYTALKTGGVARPLQKVAELREAIGPDIDLCVDLHGPPDLSIKDAMIIGRELEKYRLLFWEEPVSAEHWEGLARLRDTVAIPLAGERLATIFEFHRLLSLGCADVLQPDTGRAGGISQMRKIAALAEPTFATIAPHSGSLGPVAEFAALHLMATIPNALILERFSHDWPGRDLVVTPQVQVVDGHIAVPDRPGLGVELVKPEIMKHPPGHNAGIRPGAGSGTYEHGTYAEHVQTQTRWRRASYFAN